MNSKIVSFPKPMSPADFEKAVRDRARFSHMVGLTDHAKERMAERGITLRMVLRALRKGTIVGKRLKYSAVHGNWSAPMVGVTAGKELTVVCSLRGDDLYVTIVTAYG